MKISGGRDLVGYGAFLNETFLGGQSCRYGWRFQDVGWDSFHVKVGWKYWRTIIWNPCLCAAILMCQWDVFLGIIHCVWCQMPWPNDLATCLSQICLPWFVQEWICSTCLGVCVSFPMLFLWFTSLSLSFIHSDYALTNLVSLGNCSYDTPTFIRPFFFLNAGWFVSASKTNRPPWSDQESAPMGLQKFPMNPWKNEVAERRLFF